MDCSSKWETKKYKLKSVQLTDKFVAVYADLGDDGLSDLRSTPVHAICVATITEKFWEGNQSSRMSWVLRRQEVSTDLIGMILSDGWFQIVNEDDNFAGLMEVGGNMHEATGCLKGKYRKFRNEPCG